MWPKLQKDPIGEAIAEISNYYMRHQRKPTKMICSPECYKDLVSVGAGYLKATANGWEIDGALLSYDIHQAGYKADD